jgi:hypothetical protein
MRDRGGETVIPSSPRASTSRCDPSGSAAPDRAGLGALSNPAAAPGPHARTATRAAERQLRPEDGLQLQVLRRLGEAGDAVEPVVVGDRERVHPSRSASSASSAGEEAPSRKENDECACNSA